MGKDHIPLQRRCVLRKEDAHVRRRLVAHRAGRSEKAGFGNISFDKFRTSILGNYVRARATRMHPVFAHSRGTFTTLMLHC